jgi:hypothetical protein
VAVPFEEIGLSISLGENRLNKLPQDFESKGLAQDGTGCQFRWPVRMLRRWSAAHQDDAPKQTGPAANNRQEEGISGHLRKANIEQHKIEVRFFQHPVRRVRIGHRDDFVVERFECPLQGRSKRGFIIDNEDPVLLQEATWVKGVR